MGGGARDWVAFSPTLRLPSQTRSWLRSTTARALAHVNATSAPTRSETTATLAERSTSGAGVTAAKSRRVLYAGRRRARRCTEMCGMKPKQSFCD